VGRAPAPPEVADAFGVPDGTELVVRRHVVRTDDAPVEVGASWFRAADAAGTTLERAEAFGRPLYQEVEEVTGRRYATATDTISARQPTREEAEILQIRPDTPVLHLLHVAYDGGRTPIEVAQATWPGPMTTLTEEYRVPGPEPDADGDPGLVLG
jgi:GntR family transcriptional regulator